MNAMQQLTAAQGCSVPEALALLSSLNFTAVGPTRCAMSRYGCDVTFVRGTFT